MNSLLVFHFHIENHQFINALTGTPDDGGANNLTVSTRSVIPHTAEHDNRHLVFLDTPGLDGTFLSDELILTIVAKWLESKCVNVSLRNLAY